ncbi:MAG: bacterial Ig-like domain-containing protein, partial [Candidatus Methanomethylophilaceae archaeon]|nr:bacterial Ig-like domain-containing protein [Candidatus Methanomethylophilaceae archaeon]
GAVGVQLCAVGQEDVIYRIDDHGAFRIQNFIVRTVEVVFSQIRHTLTVEKTGNGTVTHGIGDDTSTAGSKQYVHGTHVTVMFSASSGHAVSDVKVNGIPKGAVESLDLTMTSDVKVEVLFTESPVFLTVTHNEGGTVTPDGRTGHVKGTSLTITVAPSDGYAIDSVKVDGVAIQDVPPMGSHVFGIVMDSDRIVEASFIELHSIEVSVEGEGSVKPSGIVTVRHGDSQAFNLYPADGWHILHTKLDGEVKTTSSSFTLYNVSSDHSLVAVFEKDPINLTHITVDTTGANLVYTVGDVFNRTGLVVTAHYSDGTSVVVTNYDLTPSRFTGTGVQTVTVSYGPAGNVKTATFDVSVQPTGGVDVFVTGHDGDPVPEGTHLAAFPFDTSNMAPGDVRTLSLRIQVDGASGLEAFVNLAGLKGDLGLAQYVNVEVSSGGTVLDSATLSEMWSGRTVDLGVLPSGGLDVVVAVSILDNDDASLMDSSVTFNLEAGAGRSVS